MVGDTLPDWADVDFLQAVTAVLIFVAAALLGATLIWVRSVGVKVALSVLLIAAAFGLFQYRESLVDCEKTCDCSLAGNEVPNDGCTAPIAAPRD